MHLKVLEINVVKIYLAYIKHALCSLKDWRCKYFTKRYINICKAVLKYCLLTAIINLHYRYFHIRFIAVTAFDPDILCCIKHIYNSLLDNLVLVIIKSIYLDNLIKNLSELVACLW